MKRSHQRKTDPARLCPVRSFAHNGRWAQCIGLCVALAAGLSGCGGSDEPAAAGQALTGSGVATDASDWRASVLAANGSDPAIGHRLVAFHLGQALGSYGAILREDGWAFRPFEELELLGSDQIVYLSADDPGLAVDRVVQMLGSFPGVVVLDGAASPAAQPMLRALGLFLDEGLLGATALVWTPRSAAVVPMTVHSNGAVNGMQASERKKKLLSPALLAARNADENIATVGHQVLSPALAAAVDLASTAFSPAPGANGLLEPAVAPPAGVTFFPDPTQVAGIFQGNVRWMQGRIAPAKSLSATQLAKVRTFVADFRALTLVQRNEVVKAYLRAGNLSGGNGVAMTGKPAAVLLAMRDSGVTRPDGIGRVIESSRLQNYTNAEVATLRSLFAHDEVSYFNWAKGEMLRLDPLADYWYARYVQSRSQADYNQWASYRTRFRQVEVNLQNTHFRFAYIESRCTRRLLTEVDSLSRQLSLN